jgi:hypothetical protein
MFDTKTSTISAFLFQFILLICFIEKASQHSVPSFCTFSNQTFYNYLTHSCSPCPPNTRTASDPTFCNCSFPTYYANPNAIGFNYANSCLKLIGKLYVILSISKESKSVSSVAEVHQRNGGKR